MNLRLAIRRQIANPPGIERDCVQVLTQFVVQLAREMTAFRFLRFDALAREAPVVGEEPLGRFLRCAPAQQFPL